MPTVAIPIRRYTREVSDLLVLAGRVGLAPELIDRRYFAVVDMGDGSWSPVRMARIATDQTRMAR